MRDLSPSGLELIKRFEGLRLAAYDDGGGVYTIGYGHTKGVKRGDTCTLKQAQAWLLDDTAVAVAAVNRLVRAVLTQTQFDVLVSFTFNEGAGRPKGHPDGPAGLAGSTLLELLNQGHYDLVPHELRKWVYDNGKVVPGLVNRREAEAELWESTLKHPEIPETSPVPRLGLWQRIKSLLGF